MTPQEREKFDLDIYKQTKEEQFHGCLSDAADYMRQKDSSKISRQLNPGDGRKDTLFGEAMDVLEAFYYKHPELAIFIWNHMSLRWHAVTRQRETARAKLLNTVRLASNEQLDVYHAIASDASEADLVKEAYEAFQHSKQQYEQIAGVKLDGFTN